MADAHKNIDLSFKQLAHAVVTGSLEIYRKLALSPNPTQEEIFVRNSDTLREKSMRLRLKEIQQEGDQATVTFDVVDAKGAAVDESRMHFRLAGSQWKLASF